MENKGKLILIATPIGNLSDFSPRAVEELKDSDLILCEDTRNSGKLLKHFEINKPLVSYHEHNERQREENIIERLKNGEKISLITDAGMPAVSDPGAKIVDAVHKNGLSLTCVPGANAVLTAIALSGFDSSRFEFIGFLSRVKQEKIDTIKSTINYPGLSVIYEAPKRVAQTLDIVEELCPGREVFVARELTKLHEELFRASTKEAAEKYRENPKGEFVIVLNSYKVDEEIDIKEELSSLIKEGISKSKAVKLVAKNFDLSKNEVYKVSLELED